MIGELSSPVLVLDAGYQAVNIVPVRRALSLLARGKAVVVEERTGALLRSEKLRLGCPVIIRLLIAIAHRVYRTLRVRFNKRNVLARDAWTCQYCGATDRFLTVDHVVPRSRRSKRFPNGGPHTWENCVTACLECNNKKGDRLPEEAGMALARRPTRPRWVLALPFGRGHSLETWQKYLP
jgi:hypothetical protein